MTPRPLVFVSLLFVPTGALACTDVTNPPEIEGPVAFAMTADTPAAFMGDMDEGLFEMYLPVELPVRAPAPDELASLMRAPHSMPWMSAPWVERGDLGIDLEIVFTNPDDAPHTFRLAINARNELFVHVPMVGVDELGGIVADYASYEQFVTVPAKGRARWHITEEEMDEMAIDFAAVLNGAPNANQVFYYLNQSTEDARTRRYIPSVVPGLVGFNLGVRSESAINIAVEATMRIYDRSGRGRLWRDGDTRWMLPVPVPFTPVPPPEEM